MQPVLLSARTRKSPPAPAQGLFAEELRTNIRGELADPEHIPVSPGSRSFANKGLPVARAGVHGAAEAKGGEMRAEGWFSCKVAGPHTGGTIGFVMTVWLGEEAAGSQHFSCYMRDDPAD